MKKYHAPYISVVNIHTRIVCSSIGFSSGDKTTDYGGYDISENGDDEANFPLLRNDIWE